MPDATPQALPDAPPKLIDARIDGKRVPSGQLILKEVGLSVAAGEIVALLGASGAGKTTLLRTLLGLDAAFDGTVRSRAARIGMVFQEPRLLPWRSIADNVGFAAGALSQAEISRLLAAVGLEGTESLYPRQISLGMARRVALARALAIDPDLLVLDEPFASLDPRMAARLASLLRDHVQMRPAGVLVAMHDVARATSFATRIVVLSGRPAGLLRCVDIPAAASQADRLSLQKVLVRAFPFLADAAATSDAADTV